MADLMKVEEMRFLVRDVQYCGEPSPSPMIRVSAVGIVADEWGDDLQTIIIDPSNTQGFRLEEEAETSHGIMVGVNRMRVEFEMDVEGPDLFEAYRAGDVYVWIRGPVRHGATTIDFTPPTRPMMFCTAPGCGFPVSVEGVVCHACQIGGRGR